MKNFKISDGLRPYIKKVLDKKGIAYIERDNSIKADCSGMEFHRTVTRARCEKKNQEEQLPPDTTYYVKKIESENSVREFNSEYIRFIEM
jgi:hypothetical protein